MNLRKYLILACIFIFTSITIFSQKPSDLVKEYKSSSFDSYELVKSGGRSTINLTEEVSDFDLFTLDKENIRTLYNESPDNFKLALPLKKRSNINLLLVEIQMPLMEVEAAPSGKSISYKPGKHYRGIIEGQEGSWAAISVYDNEIYGLISEERSESNYVLGKLKDEDTHILYNDADLQKAQQFSCSSVTSSVPQLKPEEIFSDKAASFRNTKCVRLYFEVDNDIVTNKGGETGAINYITALYNQMAILYSNEQINTSISKILVWTSTSPYSGTSTSGLLDQFGNTRTTFDGDLAMLVAYKGNGGVAYVNGFCAFAKRYSMGYSSIGSSFSNVPTYSWTVNVLAHEFGHLFGSPHTHDCSWNGNNTAIDGCSAPEGSCPRPANPTNGGTIMSYCHNVSGVGVNFQNGFGPQPGNLMRSRVAAASCVGQCTTTQPCPDSSFPTAGLSKANQSFIAGTPFIVTATASDNGSISKVEFWQGTTLLATDLTSPYEFTLNAVNAGSFSIIARAYDNCNNQTNSTSRTYTATVTCTDGVKNGAETGIDCGGSCTACQTDPCTGNTAPTVNLTKTNQNFIAGTPFIVPATASDNGSISKVEFWQGATLLGTDNTSPYEYTINSVAAATFTIVARAYDNCGAQTNSTSRTYTATATCTDGVKNGTETGVDCGGSCTACQTGCVNGTLTLVTDNYPSETSWRIRNSSNVIIASGSGYTKKFTTYNINLCLPAGSCLTFTINDAFGDGMCCLQGQGSYKIVFNGQTLISGGQFTNTESKQFCVPGSVTPTCNDGIKNGNETGVDCGGSCPACPTDPCAGNTAPTASLTKPSQSFVAGTPFIVTASATDNGTVSKVEFWQGTTLVGTDNAAPYEYTINSSVAASFTIVARAYDNCGAQTNSTANTYSATATCSDGVKNGTETGVDCGGSCTACQTDPCAGNTAPSVSLSKSNQNFIAGTPFIVTSSTSDNGSVSKVEFWNGTTLLATDNSSPFEFTLNSTVAATFTIVARAYDNCGAQTNSTSRTYTATSTCTDGVKNGTETGVDCGGSCTACQAGCVNGTLTLNTDNYPTETSWRIRNSSNVTVASGSGYSSKFATYNINLCLPAGTCYTFTINDAFGDGMCCLQGQGSYKLVFNGQTLISGGQFTNVENKQFCVPGTSNNYQSEQNGFTVYPNPTNSFVVVKNDGHAENQNSKNSIKLEIFDNVGKMVLSHQNDNNPEFRLNVDHLPIGQYFVRISDVTGILDQTKLVIIR